MDETASRALAARLYERRNEAVSIRRVRMRGGDWQPDPNQCHRNVTLWCGWYPIYTAVRGWLVADYVDIGRYRFFAHSIVENETGDLMDITPNPASWSYPFLKHDPADGDFADIIEEQKTICVTHYLPSRHA
jgi:hypothetical protein